MVDINDPFKHLFLSPPHPLLAQYRAYAGHRAVEGALSAFADKGVAYIWMMQEVAPDVNYVAGLHATLAGAVEAAKVMLVEDVIDSSRDDDEVLNVVHELIDRFNSHDQEETIAWIEDRLENTDQKSKMIQYLVSDVVVEELSKDGTGLGRLRFRFTYNDHQAVWDIWHMELLP